MAERRKFFRLATSIKVTYHRSRASEKERTSFTKNISCGGIWLIVDEELRDLESLVLKIFIPPPAFKMTNILSVDTYYSTFMERL